MYVNFLKVFSKINTGRKTPNLQQFLHSASDKMCLVPRRRGF